MFSRLHSFFLAGVLLLTPAASRAVTIYDNFSEPTSGSDTVSATQWNANKFVTDSNAYILSSVSLRLSAVNTSSDLEVVLYSDSSNTPGSLIASIGSSNVIGGSESTVTFVNPTVSLAANTVYWIVMRTSGSGNYRSHFPSTTNGTGVAFNTLYSRSNNGGASWANNTNPAFAPYYLQIAADVPEPGSLLLGGIGLALLGLGSRRRRA